MSFAIDQKRNKRCAYCGRAFPADLDPDKSGQPCCDKCWHWPCENGHRLISEAQACDWQHSADALAWKPWETYLPKGECND